MPYTLSALQNAAFTDTVDLYRPTANASASKLHQGVTYTLAYSSVRCRIQSKPENLATGPLGRTNKDQVDTTDMLRVHSGQEVGSTFFVHLRTVGHPEEDSWFAVLGDSQNHVWRGSTSKFFITKSTAPLVSELTDETADAQIYGGAPL